jgi:hypothetical protein
VGSIRTVARTAAVRELDLQRDGGPLSSFRDAPPGVGGNLEWT